MRSRSPTRRSETSLWFATTPASPAAATSTISCLGPGDGCLTSTYSGSCTASEHSYRISEGTAKAATSLTPPRWQDCGATSDSALRDEQVRSGRHVGGAVSAGCAARRRRHRVLSASASRTVAAAGPRATAASARPTSPAGAVAVIRAGGRKTAKRIDERHRNFQLKGIIKKNRR
jgi:hypothetical protein